jgi:DNA segregation ATPase FtsK/SpoIIIE, S-DNA-T family
VARKQSQVVPQRRKPHDALVWLFLWPLMLLKWLLVRPLGLATVAGYVALATWVPGHTGEMVVGYLVALPILFVAGWWLTSLLAAAMGRPRLREQWELRVAWRLRALRRKLLIYKPRWQRAVRGAGLVKTRPGERDALPRITRIKPGRYVDQLKVRMLDGQDPETWEARSSALAHSLRSRRVAVREDRPGRIVLEVAAEDPLRHVVDAFPVRDFDSGMDVTKFLQGVPIGLSDDGTTWRLQVLGKHVLVAGSMGSGKGSVIWSALAQLAPLIHEGLVEVWAADPKGGMELGIGAPLFARMETTPESIVGMLEQAADRMDERCDRFHLDGTRLHQPTREDPLVLVLVDEIASLTAYGPKQVRDRAHLALARLLTKGRAPAYVVFGALQDPRKEVLNLRDLFNVRVCLRVESRDVPDMVLGPKMREAGALCDRIKHAPNTEQGVGYVKLDDVWGVQRVRACWQSDEMVRGLAERFPWPGETLTVPREFEAV